MGDGWSEMRHQCFLLGSAIITPLLRGPGASCTNISSYRLCFSVLRWLATIFKQELWGQGYRVKAKGEHAPTLPPPLTKQADVTRVPQFWCASKLSEQLVRIWDSGSEFCWRRRPAFLMINQWRQRCGSSDFSKYKNRPCGRKGENTRGCGENLRTDSGMYMCKQEEGSREGKSEWKGDKVAAQRQIWCLLCQFGILLRDRKWIGRAERVGTFSISKAKALLQAVGDSRSIFAGPLSTFFVLPHFLYLWTLTTFLERSILFCFCFSETRSSLLCVLGQTSTHDTPWMLELLAQSSPLLSLTFSYLQMSTFWNSKRICGSILIFLISLAFSSIQSIA